jgi:iron complex transport system permease protein
VSRRKLILGAVLSVFLVLVVGVALLPGDLGLRVDEVAAALSGRGEEVVRFIVAELRLPRVLAAVLGGALLAASGSIFQTLVRNPLASPDIIGVTAGASVAAVFWITTGGERALLTPVALSGALAAAALVYLLSRRAHVTETRLVLVGIGINAMLTAVVTLLVVRGNINDVSRAYQWLAGSLYGSSREDVRLLGLSVLSLLPAAGIILPAIRPLRLGDEHARSLGVRVEAVRLAYLAVGCAMSSVAVALTGPIGFVALMVPHFARAIGGSTSLGLLVITALLGGLLLVVTDLVGQHLLPVTLPVGLLTAAVGAPYFLVLLYRRRVS